MFENINFGGLLVGLATFIIIGVFHPLVIKGEYYFGLKCRWWFGAAGVLMCVLSLILTNTVASVLVGVVAFSCFWSIGEVTEQQERVRKGWFPRNPKRTYPFDGEGVSGSEAAKKR